MNIFPNEMTNSPARSYASTRAIPTLSSRHEKSLKTGTHFGLIIMGSTPPPPPLPAETEGTKQGGKHRAWRNFILVMKFLLQVARRERIKDAVIIKEEVRQCTWAKKSSEVWEEERTRSVCFGLIFAWQSLSPPISRLWAAQPVKKIHPPPTTLTTRPRQGAHDLNFELERGERIKKISVFFSSEWPTKQIFSFSRTDSNSGVEAQKTIL